MKKRVFILLLAVFNAVGVYALNINSTSTQTGENDIIDGILNVGNSKNVTYTINGNLTVNGSMTVYSGSSVIVNGTLTVSGTITVNGNITVNGKVEAGSVDVFKTMTVNGDAILHTTGDLDIEKDGKITLRENSTTIVENNLNQKGSTALGWGIAFPNTGDVDAYHATLIVGGDYTIYTAEGVSFLGFTLASGVDSDAEYINPKDNVNFVVLGENELSKIPGIDGSVLEERKAEFIAANGNDVSAYAAIVMPIELVYFEVYNSGEQVYFKWQTASELNNDYFTIESSIDAEDFEPLATVQGSGTTNYTVDYDYQYRLNYVGTMYYRLKQTDYDGSSSYSKTVAVTFAAKAVKKADSFTVYPNPVTDFITIAGGEYESVTFVTSAGVIIDKQSAQQTHSVTNLPSGYNVVIISTANGNVSKTIIKQ
ncbi:MAG: T9SS type A sorting domain-containing protein [Salinivirgaceae bacterium]|nr:T9SS type A sorting domain-containing protein [Salinivirgaceae bacterium]